MSGGVGRVGGGGAPVGGPDETAAADAPAADAPAAGSTATTRSSAGSAAGTAARAVRPSDAGIASALWARAPFWTSPDALYEAARSVAAGDTGPLTRLDAAGREQLAAALETSLAQRNTGPDGKPLEADLKARSGAATLTLALLKTLPPGDPAAARLTAAYVNRMGAETERGLKASMTMNLEQARLPLSDAQKASLAKAKEEVLPSRPPYDEWFKDGRSNLNVRHYVHPEYYDLWAGEYERLGFAKQTQADRVVYTKTQKDPTGRNPDVPIRVEVVKTEKRTFRDMDDPNVQVEFYSGHSNLGGNVLGALADGPELQRGAKWVVNWMCRGKQVAADVYNRFPDAHYMTTSEPPSGGDGQRMLGPIYEGIARRESYRFISGKAADQMVTPESAFIYPDDARILSARDFDRDGRVEVRKDGVDPLYDVALGDRTKPRGDAVRSAVDFLNTFTTYHKEHGNDGRLPAIGDKIVSDGWFDGGGADEMVRVTEKTVGRDKQWHVAVNRRFADRDPDEIAVSVAYELNKAVTLKTHGTFTEDDKLRGALFAGEYCAYMVDTYGECDSLTRGLARRYGLSSRLDWDKMNAAIDSDSHGYATPGQIEELRRLIR